MYLSTPHMHTICCEFSEAGDASDIGEEATAQVEARFWKFRVPLLDRMVVYAMLKGPHEAPDMWQEIRFWRFNPSNTPRSITCEGHVERGLEGLMPGP